MLTFFSVNGFKSFHNMEMHFTPFTVIAGANASGKSNLFDALKLLSRLAEADNLKKAFREQRGEFLELFTQYGNGAFAKEISFCAEMIVDRTVKDAWGNEAVLKYTRLRYELVVNRYTNSAGIEDLSVSFEKLENLKHQSDDWIKFIPKGKRDYWRPKVKTGKRGTPYIDTIKEHDLLTVFVPQDGTSGNKRRFPIQNATRTVLSSFDTVDFPHVFAAKEEMRSWKFLQLNPEDLRQPTSKSMGSDVVSESGKNLAAALYRIKLENPYALKEISRKLQTFLPEFITVDVFDDTENRQYVIRLTDINNRTYSSRVLSEGTLRILTLCIFEHDSKFSSLLCFEEPENGVNPVRISIMAKLLRELSTNFEDEYHPLRQVIVNTHSPVLVKEINNWVKDDLVSIWYAEIRKRVTTIDEQRMVLNITNMSPVSKEGGLQMNIFETSEQDKKITLAKVDQYLSTLTV